MNNGYLSRTNQPMGCLKITYHQEVRQLGENHFFLGEWLEKGATDEKNCIDYYPFGSVASHWEKEPYRFGYQGQYAEEDPETGFSHFEAREYDATIGRWMVKDPARQYASPYLGMGNNPISQVDPDGRYSKFGVWWRNGFSMKGASNPTGNWNGWGYNKHVGSRNFSFTSGGETFSGKEQVYSFVDGLNKNYYEGKGTVRTMGEAWRYQLYQSFKSDPFNLRQKPPGRTQPHWVVKGAIGLMPNVAVGNGLKTLFMEEDLYGNYVERNPQNVGWATLDIITPMPSSVILKRSKEISNMVDYGRNAASFFHNVPDVPETNGR